MTFETIRRRIAACGRVAMVSVVMASQVEAQGASSGSADAGWGAEGRIGSGTSVYLTRWFNNDWSFLAGGSFSFANQTNNGSATLIKSENRQVQMSALIRRNWGAGSVRPFLAFGPTVLFGSDKVSGTSGGAVVSDGSKQRGYGGRGEFGALVPVASRVFLGLSSGVSVGRTTSKNSTFDEYHGKTTRTSVDFGNLQFIVAFKF